MNDTDVIDPMSTAAIEQWGVFTRQQALAAGMLPTEIARALRTKQITSVRRTFYAHQAAHADVVAAVEAGGVLSGLSALKLYGVEVPHDRRLHVRIPRATRSRRIRKAKLNGRHRVGFSHARLGEQPIDGVVDSPEVALAFVAANCSAEDLGVVLDSMMRRGLLTLHDVDRLAPILPRRLVSAVRFASNFAESVSESLVHRRLRALRVSLRQQVWIEDMRVDFVIGDRLILEVDSEAHHGNREQRRRDYRRDRRLQAMGYVVFRIDYMDVMETWEQIVREILAFIRKRGHSATSRLRGSLRSSLLAA